MEPKELYESLLGARMYTDSYDQFKKDYGTEEDIAELHKQLLGVKAYTGDLKSFKSDYFQEVKKKVSTKDSAFDWGAGTVDVSKLSSTQTPAPTAGKKSEYNWSGGKNEQLATVPYATSEVSSEVKDSPQTAALKSIRERRGTDYSTSAADMAKGRIDIAAKKTATPLEMLHSAASQLSFGDWVDEPSTPKYNPDQRTAAEFNAFSKSLSDENREIGLAIKALESKMKLEYGVDMEDYGGMVAEFNAIQANASKIVEAFNKLPDNKKTQEEADRVNSEIERLTESSKSVMQRLEEIQATPEFEEMSNLYELSNINTKKYEDELKTGKYDHAKQFGDYLQYRQKLKDESYKKMSGFEKVFNSTGTVILHSLAKVPQSIASLTDVIEKSAGLEGDKVGVGDMLQDAFIGLGDDIQAAFPAPTKLQRGGFTDTAKWGEYQVDFTSDGEIQSIRDKDGYIMDAMLSEQQEKEIKSLKKERQFNSQSFAYQTGSTIVDIGIQILGTKGIGGIKALPGVVGTSWGLPRIGMKALGSEVGMIATTAGMMSNDLYNEGLKNGLSEDDAARYALSTGTVIGLVGTLSGIGIEEQLLLKSKLPSIGLRDKMPGFVGRKAYDVIKGGAGEFTEEIILEKLGQAGVQYAMNEMAGGKFDIQPYKDTTSIINEAATAVVAGGLFSLAKSGKEANGMQRSMLADGSKDIPKTIEMVKEVAAAAGQPLTIAEEAELKRELETTKNTIDKIPEDQKTNPDVVETMVEKTKVDEEISAKKEEIKAVDPAFQQDAKNEIAQLEVKSAELAIKVAEQSGVTPDEKAVKMLEPKEGVQPPVVQQEEEVQLREGGVYVDEETGVEYRFVGQEEGVDVFDRLGDAPEQVRIEQSQEFKGKLREIDQPSVVAEDLTPVNAQEPVQEPVMADTPVEPAMVDDGDTSSPVLSKRLRGFYANSLKKMGGVTPGQGLLADIGKSDPQFYDQMTRAGNAQAIADEIDSDGLEVVVQRAMQENPGEPEGISAARRVVSLIALGNAMVQANAAGDTQALDAMRGSARDLERLLGKKGTEYGQALSMYAIYSQTPEGQLVARLRDVEERRERGRSRVVAGGKQVGEVVDSIVDEVAKELKLTKEEVVAGLKESITVRNAIIRATKERKQAEKELGEALRAIGKSILGKAGALPSVDIALIKKAFVAIKKLVKNSVTEARIKLSSELQKLGVDPEAALVELETKFPELFVEKNNEDIKKAVKKAAKKESGVAEMTDIELLEEMKRLAEKAREQMEAEKKAARDRVTVLAALMESKKGLDKKSKEQEFVKDKAGATQEAKIKIEKDKEIAQKKAEQSAREATIRKSIADSKKKAAQAEDRYKTINRVIKALSQKEKSQEKKITEAQEILRSINEEMGIFIDEKMIEASMENIDPTLPANEIAARIASQFNMTKAMEIAMSKAIEKAISDKVAKAKASRLKQIVRTHVKSAKKARVIENGLLEAITIGGLNDDVIRRKLEEKYGIKSFTNEQINELNDMVMSMKAMPSRGQKFKQMREMMDYIHLHGGLDVPSLLAATWYAKVLFSVKTIASVLIGNEVNFWTTFAIHGLATNGGMFAMSESFKRLISPTFRSQGKQPRGVWFGLTESLRFIKTGEASREMKKVARSADLELVARMNFRLLAKDAMTSLANIPNTFLGVVDANSLNERMSAVGSVLSQMGESMYKIGKAAFVPAARGLKFSLRLISAADSIRYYSMLDFTLDRKAYQIAEAEGLTGDAAKRRAREIIGESIQTTRELYDQAAKEFEEYAAATGRKYTDVDIAYRAREISEERLEAAWRKTMEADAKLQGQFQEAVQMVMDANPGMDQERAEKVARRIRNRYQQNQASPIDQARLEAEKVALQNDPRGVMGLIAEKLSGGLPGVFSETLLEQQPDETGDAAVDSVRQGRWKIKMGAAKAMKVYSSFLFPFMKTMANVVTMKMEYLPGFGVALKGVDSLVGSPSIDWKNEEQRRVFFAKQITGFVLATSIGLWMRMHQDDEEETEGIITLKGTKDQNTMNAEKEMKKWKQETVVIGGKRVYYGDTPFAAVLGILGRREDERVYAKPGEEDDWTMSAMAMAIISQMFTNASYLQTFSSINTAISEGNSDKFLAALATPISGVAGGGIQRDFDRWFSPELRDRKSVESRFFGEMLSRTPVAANYLLDFKYNSIGETINPYENESIITQAIGLDKYISGTEVSNPIFEILVDKKVRFREIGMPDNIFGTEPTYQEARDYTLFVCRYRKAKLSENLQSMRDMSPEQLEVQLQKTDSEGKEAAKVFILLQRKDRSDPEIGQKADVSVSKIDSFIREYDQDMIKDESEMFMEEMNVSKPDADFDKSLFF